jgi:hypothetical protein
VATVEGTQCNDGAFKPGRAARRGFSPEGL